MISCLVRSSDLLPSIVRALYKQLKLQNIPQMWDYFHPTRALLSSQRDTGESRGGLGMSVGENKALVKRFVDEFWTGETRLLRTS